MVIRTDIYFQSSTRFALTFTRDITLAFLFPEFGVFFCEGDGFARFLCLNLLQNLREKVIFPRSCSRYRYF